MQAGSRERRVGLLRIHEGEGKEGKKQRGLHLSEDEL